jgi:hypothetical protein
MTSSSYPNIKSLIYSILAGSAVFQTLKECRQNFIINVFLCFLSIKGRINFLQTGRFSEKCEQFFRIHFENGLNFQGFNLSLIKEKVSECIVAFDPVISAKAVRKHTALVPTGQAAPAAQSGGWKYAVLLLWTFCIIPPFT